MIVLWTLFGLGAAFLILNGAHALWEGYRAAQPEEPVGPPRLVQPTDLGEEGARRVAAGAVRRGP